MKILKTLSFSLVLFSTLHFANAQTATLTDIVSVSLRNVGAIVSQENLVNGYFFFYKIDKADKKNNNYLLKILNANLGEVVSKNIVESKNIYLSEASYDGIGSICLKFYDFKEKISKYQIYNKEGNLVGNFTDPVNSMELMVAQMDAGKDQASNVMLYEIQKKGFVSYSYIDNKKLGYGIRFMSSDGKSTWTTTSAKDSKEVEGASYLASDENNLYSIVYKRPGLMSREMTGYIVAHDIKTGAKLFEVPTKNEKYQYMYSTAYYNPVDMKTYLFGQYYDINAKMIKDASLGLFIHSIDKTGKMEGHKYVSWKDQVSKFIPVDEKGKMENVGNLFFHNIIRSPDGKMYAISEQYRKTIGIGSLMTPPAKMITEDMAIFEFSDKFELKNVKIFDKTKSAMTLSDGTSFVDAQLLAYLVKAYGGFDFAFTQTNKAKNNFTICYIDLEKEPGKKRTLKFVAQTKTGNADYVTDKISLETEATDIMVMPSKPGSVLLLEYFKKEKNIKLRLEKINF
jgi:hypothetical protein